MKSATPKVLHKIAGLPMLGHVLNAAAGSGATALCVVVGPGMEAVGAFVAKTAPIAETCVQAERLGTGHAVLTAKKAINRGPDDVLVLYRRHTAGDRRDAETPARDACARRRHRRARLPPGGPRPVMAGWSCKAGGSSPSARRRTPARRRSDRPLQCRRHGISWGSGWSGSSARLATNNAKGEYYLTDAVAIAAAAGRNVAVVEAPADEVAGVNARVSSPHVEGLWQKRAREAAMAAGVTMIAPSTVWFSHDTRLGRDVTLEPNVFFGPGVTVADNVVIRANCHIEGATIASGAIIGPFARLRPGADIGENVHIGNFVEVKSARLDAGAKANHLAYIGDAHVGARTNIGAGTITANYDGFDKFRTEIGAGVSIGSNAVLVAPVRIGDGASVAAGSVITHDVAADALAVARGQQVDKPGWAAKFREKKMLSRAARKKS